MTLDQYAKWFRCTQQHGGARISPYINRFIQPDTIIPNPANPQSWNRFSYVENRPTIFTDPTGHVTECDDGPQTWAACREQLHNFALRTLNELGGRDDLEALALIVERAADLYKNFEDMIPALSGVFLGIEESNPLTILHAAGANPCAAIGREPKDCPENAETGAFWDTGFHEDFRDDHSQPFHFWAYLATAASTQYFDKEMGTFMALRANEFHEFIFGEYSGQTWADFGLSLVAIDLGGQVARGEISPDELGNTIRNRIGPNSPGFPASVTLVKYFPLPGDVMQKTGCRGYPPLYC